MYKKHAENLKQKSFLFYLIIQYSHFMHKSDILKENYQKILKKITLFFFRTACHPFVTRMSFVCHVILMSLVCTRMPSVCHSCILVCHPYVNRIYPYVIRVSLVCTHMSSVCVTRMRFYPRMSSVCHSYVVLAWTVMNCVLIFPTCFLFKTYFSWKHISLLLYY